MSDKPKTKEAENAFLFIDGNNFYHILKCHQLDGRLSVSPGEIDFSKLSKVICDFFGVEHSKTIYYNSVPDIRDGEEAYYKHMQFLDDLKKLPRLEVKTRKLQKHSTEEILRSRRRKIGDLDLCGKCKPLIEKNCAECIGDFKKKEKGIDVMIAVDMIEAAIKDKCDCCILLSGDADFVPALELVQKNGKKAFSSAMPRGYSTLLREKFKFFTLYPDLLEENCLKA
ncbi:MAG: NYN domain-containing protein [archaeon]